MKTNLNLYKYFSKVYELRSITKAAENLYISQPSLSYSIKQLENQLGVSLFTKSINGVTPTAYAHKIYAYVQDSFKIIDNGEKSLTIDKNVGKLRIGSSSHISGNILLPFLIDYKEMYPMVNIEIVSKSKSEMLEMLSLNELDIVLDFLPFKTLNKYRTLKIERLKSMDNCFIASMELLDKYKVIKKNDLNSYPFIFQGTKEYPTFELLKNYKINTDNVKIKTWTSEVMIKCVEKNLGIGYCVKDIVKEYLQEDKIKIIESDFSLPQIDLAIVFNKNHINQEKNIFIQELKKHIGEID